MTKRLLSMVLAVLLTVTALPIAVFGETVETTDYDTQYSELLTALGIYTANDTDMYDAGYYVSRGYFAVLLKRFSNSDKTYSEAELRNILKFSDVDPSGEMAEGIAFCIENGYMNGTEDYSFEPDARITLEQAVKPLIILLGRKSMAEEKGGYPAGYMTAAKKLDLLDGVSENMGDTVNRLAMASLLYNSLMSEYLELYKIEPDEDGVYIYEQGNDKTYLREVFDIELISGVVTGNENTMLSVSDKSADEGCVIIDGITVQGSTLHSYLGYYVDCYARVDEKNRTYENVYTAVNPTRNKILTIQAEDIASFTDGTYSYYDEHDRIKKVDISASADVIFNGVAKPDYTDGYMTPESGSVTLIDTGKGWNVVLVTYYNTAVVGYVDTKNEKIILKDNGGIIDYGEADSVYIEISGDKAVPADLTEWDVVSIAADKMADSAAGKLDITNSEIFDIRVQRGGGFTSPLTGIEEDVVVFGGHRYEFSENLKRNKPSLKLGVSYKGAVDKDGRLAYLKEEKSGGSYAILTRVAAEGTWKKTVMLRMFTSEGDWKTYNTADKVKIDGSYVEADDIAEMLNKKPYASETTGKLSPCLVKYSLDSDLNIKDIDTPVRGSEENDESLSAPIIQTGTVTMATTAAWFLDGAFFVRDNTTYFNVPTSMGVIDASRESSFSVGSKLADNTVYHSVATESVDGFNGYKEAVYAYNIDEYKQTDMLVYTKEFVSGMNERDLDDVIVVDNVLKSVQKDGTERTAIIGYNVKSSSRVPREFTGYLADDVVIEDNCIIDRVADMKLSDITRGDVLRVILNEIGGENEISAIRREFSPSNENACNPDLYGDICIASKEGGNFSTRSNSARQSLQFGWVYSVNNTFLTLTNERDAAKVTPSDKKSLYGFWPDKTVKPFVLYYDRDMDKITVSEDFTSIPTFKTVGDTSEMPVCLCYAGISYLKMALVIE